MRVVAQPLIAVADVEASSRWYCRLLGGTSGHGGKGYERVMVGDDFVLQLHDWNVLEHPYLGDEGSRPWGNGALLWFRVHDFDGALTRAHELGAEFLEDRHPNPGPATRRSGCAIPTATSSCWPAGPMTSAPQRAEPR